MKFFFCFFFLLSAGSISAQDSLSVILRLELLKDLDIVRAEPFPFGLLKMNPDPLITTGGDILPSNEPLIGSPTLGEKRWGISWNTWLLRSYPILPNFRVSSSFTARVVFGPQLRYKNLIFGLNMEPTQSGGSFIMTNKNYILMHSGDYRMATMEARQPLTLKLNVKF